MLIVVDYQYGVNLTVLYSARSLSKSLILTEVTGVLELMLCMFAYLANKTNSESMAVKLLQYVCN